MKTINSFRSKLLALTLALMASVSSFAYDFKDGYLFYNILPDGTVAVTSETYGIPYDYLPNSLVIPSEVNGYNGETYVVTEIANYAFSGCSMLDTLVIPNTVKKIGMYAFTGCTKLVYISFPESIEDILGGALYECAWYNNQPDGLIYIGNLLYRYKGTAPTGTIVVKDGTKAILDFTFSNQPNIQSVVLPESVTSIHIQAFGDCPNLESVVLPSKLEAIEDHTFQYCEKLTNIKLPDALKLIGKNAFIGCTNLTKLTLPFSVQIIEDEAFANCTSLTEVTCYATIPPVRGDVVSDSPSDWFFAGVDVAKIPLYVPTESIDLYKKAEQWMFFNPILPIEPTTSYKSQWCNEWNVMFSNGSVYPPSNMPYRYQLAKDTVIGEHTYTAVVSKAINDALDAPRYVAAVRFTDDRKVYIYYDNAEYLLYDFNVQEGDELEVFAGINNYRFGIKTYKCIVTGVEQYACIGCPATITLHVPNHPDDFTEIYRRTQWQEGVGDVYSGFLNGVNGYVPVDGGGSVHLLCAYQGDELKYTGDLYEEYGCGDDAEQTPEDLFPTLWGLQRTGYTKTIGENENGTVWGSRSYLMQEIETATIDGKQYLLFGIDNNYDKLYLKLWLREENNKILLYSTAQKKDLVLYDFTLNVGDSLPRLYVDYDLSSVVDYDNDEWGLSPLVVTEVSTITLLDGKEYKKWTFDNGMQYVEGIGSFGTCYAHNDFYQLIANAPLSSDVYSQYLVCASRNGKLLYQMDDTEMERLGAECLCEVEKKWSDTWCNQWNILSHGYQGPQDPLAAAHTSIFWLSNNTVNRDGHEYIPLMCSSSMPEVESTTLIGELRFTEDKKVYFNYDNTEYLLYDFDVQVGDTLDIFGGIELYSYSFVEQKTYPHVITKIDTLDDGRLQITSDAIVIFEDSYGAFEEKMPQTWIEGLGSTNGIVYTSINPGIAGDAAIVMLCAYRDDECVYKTDSNDPYWIDYTQLGCVYNEGDFIEGAFPMLSGLQRTVCNEYCGETEDDNSANNTYKQTFDSIFFENDKPYILCNDYLLREEDNKILIYSQLLNKDLVLYDFTLEVGDSLPALYIYYHPRNAMDWIPYNLDVVDYNKDFEDGTIYPADTFVVTDISNVTLLDGKEYKKWTFDNGMEYVEGIGMYGGRRGGNFFGLIQEVVVPCHTGTHLVCVSKNGQLLYQMDDAEMERLGAECLCNYNSGPKRDNAKDGQIGGRPTPTQWNQLEVVLRQMDNNHTILQAETFSYTLEDISQQVNNKTYFQLARQSTKDTATTKSVVGALHFGKDEDNRVYFLRDGVEYVLYDFTVEPGDTIEIFAGINNYPQETTYTHVVTSKDTLENGACRMMLEVVFPEETSTAENVEKVWLAGLGSVDGIVHNAAKRTSNAHAAPSRSASSSETESSVMLCAWREDSCLYTTDHPDYDTFGCVYNQDPTSVENPTSPSSYQKLLRDGQLLIIHNDKIYNVLGLDIGKSSIKIVESLTNH